MTRRLQQVFFWMQPAPALVFLLMMGTLATVSCGPPRIVRIPVSPEDIARANDAAREADSAFARKDYYTALIKYLEAGRLNPNSEYIFNKLGITYSQLQYFPQAADAFTRSIGLNPKYPYSYNNLGSVHFATGNKKKAEKMFRKAISINSEVASFHINLGTLYFERKKFEKGMAEWRKGLSLDPDILAKSEGVSLVAPGSSADSADRSYFMARLYAAAGKTDQAVESLQKALNAGFSDIEAILREPDFDPIRETVRFKEFMKLALLLNKR